MRGALATLRERIERIETHGALAPNRIALGHREADAALQGGLARGALHEVFAEGGRHGAAATGFIAGLTSRVSSRRSSGSGGHGCSTGSATWARRGSS